MERYRPAQALARAGPDRRADAGIKAVRNARKIVPCGLRGPPIPPKAARISLNLSSFSPQLTFSMSSMKPLIDCAAWTVWIAAR
jgi:hypothetical protein